MIILFKNDFMANTHVCFPAKWWKILGRLNEAGKIVHYVNRPNPQIKCFDKWLWIEHTHTADSLYSSFLITFQIDFLVCDLLHRLPLDMIQEEKLQPYVSLWTYTWGYSESAGSVIVSLVLITFCICSDTSGWNWSVSSVENACADVSGDDT